MAFCYVTRVTFFRKSPKEGGWLPGDPTLRLGGWNFQSQQRPPLHPQGEERLWRSNSTANGQ